MGPDGEQEKCFCNIKAWFSSDQESESTEAVWKPGFCLVSNDLSIYADATQQEEVGPRAKEELFWDISIGDERESTVRDGFHGTRQQ